MVDGDEREQRTPVCNDRFKRRRFERKKSVESVRCRSLRIDDQGDSEFERLFKLFERRERLGGRLAVDPYRLGKADVGAEKEPVADLFFRCEPDAGQRGVHENIHITLMIGDEEDALFRRHCSVDVDADIEDAENSARPFSGELRREDDLFFARLSDEAEQGFHLHPRKPEQQTENSEDFARKTQHGAHVFSAGTASSTLKCLV